eukprot:gene9817-biopygen22757
MSVVGAWHVRTLAELARSRFNFAGHSAQNVDKSDPTVLNREKAAPQAPGKWGNDRISPTKSGNPPRLVGTLLWPPPGGKGGSDSEYGSIVLYCIHRCRENTRGLWNCSVAGAAPGKNAGPLRHRRRRRGEHEENQTTRRRRRQQIEKKDGRRNCTCTGTEGKKQMAPTAPGTFGKNAPGSPGDPRDPRQKIEKKPSDPGPGGGPGRAILTTTFLAPHNGCPYSLLLTTTLPAKIWGLHPVHGMCVCPCRDPKCFNLTLPLALAANTTFPDTIVLSPRLLVLGLGKKQAAGVAPRICLPQTPPPPTILCTKQQHSIIPRVEVPKGDEYCSRTMPITSCFQQSTSWLINAVPVEHRNNNCPRKKHARHNSSPPTLGQAGSGGQQFVSGATVQGDSSFGTREDALLQEEHHPLPPMCGCARARLPQHHRLPTSPPPLMTKRCSSGPKGNWWYSKTGVINCGSERTAFTRSRQPHSFLETMPLHAVSTRQFFQPWLC